jgi:hypothetical protein
MVDPESKTVAAARQQGRWFEILKQILPGIVGGIVAGLFAIAGSYYATKFQMSGQWEAQKAGEQRRVVASLMGRKIVGEQLNVSRAEALLFSDYSEELWRRAGAPKDSIDFEEAKHQRSRSEVLVSDIMKSNEALFQDLATVRELFPDTPKLRELWMRIYTFKTLQRAATPHEGSNESLTMWKDENDRRIQTLAESEYGKPIDDLTAYLLDQLPH